PTRIVSRLVPWCSKPSSRRGSPSRLESEALWQGLSHPPGADASAPKFKISQRQLRRRLLFRRESAVECFALFRHVEQELRRGEARAVFGFELAAKLDELLRPHEIDVGQRAAGERRKAE